MPLLSSICPLAGVCSGCGWIERPLAEQLCAKRNALRAHFQAAGLDSVVLGDFPITSIAPDGLRDRTDLIFQRVDHIPRFGFFARDSREVMAVSECPAMSHSLQAWFSELRTNPPPISKGSLRLRVSPQGERGIWLDFANLDVKALLGESVWLRWLLARAFVEIGQKRKRLVIREGVLKLDEPVLNSWSSTFIDDKPVPLYGAVSSFTQVGTQANQALVAALGRALPSEVSGRWVELGAGIGNFTLPLAKAGAQVLAIENDALALDGLRRAAAEAGLLAVISVALLSFQLPSAALTEAIRGTTGVVADPPRSGLGKFVQTLAELMEAERPLVLVYVSCYGESFSADAAALAAIGYRLTFCEGIDQFPQTPHLETIARFERL